MKKSVLLCAVSIFVFPIASSSGTAPWVRTSGPGFKSINALAVSGRTIFAGTGGGGVFLSTNNGSSWTAVNNGMSMNTNVLSLAVNGRAIFAGTAGGGVFLSTNNGTSWTMANNGLPANSSVLSLAVNDSNIFAGTVGGGVFLSSNNGADWKPVNNGLPANSVIISFAVSGRAIFAGTEGSGVYLSANNGGSWTAVNNGLPANTTIQSLAVNGNDVFAAGTIGGMVFLSTDSGASWKPVNNGLPANTSALSLFVCSSLVFAGTAGKGVFLSMDNGTTWKALNDGLTDGTVLSLTVTDSTIFAGTSETGVWRRPLSSIVALTNLTVQQEYVMPVNYYNFTWNPVQGAAWYDIYGNNVPILHTQTQPANHQSVNGIIDSIGRATGKQLKMEDTVTFHLVARSATNQILAVSYPVHKQWVMYIGTQTSKAVQKPSGIRISGPFIDCSALIGMVRISLYSLNGEKVWVKKGSAVKTMVPDRLPRGVYTVEVTGLFGKISRTIIKK
jgi:hypothetical protein